jgi:hypothetical protein
MKRLCLIAFALPLLFVPSAASAGPISLFEAAFNVDGNGYSSIPGFQSHDLDAGSGAPFDVSAFDFSTGLGSIQVKVNGAGNHSVFAFFDLELADANNSLFDDLGEVLGTAGPGQGFEIDEPGFAGHPAPRSDIYSHVFGGVLEDVNNLAAPDDVSMALSMLFALNQGEQGLLVFSASATDPGGFRLRQFDQSGAEVFLSSSLRVVPAPVPEPALMLLLSAAMAGGAVRRRRARS